MADILNEHRNSSSDLSHDSDDIKMNGGLNTAGDMIHNDEEMEVDDEDIPLLDSVSSKKVLEMPSDSHLSESEDSCNLQNNHPNITNGHHDSESNKMECDDIIEEKDIPDGISSNKEPEEPVNNDLIDGSKSSSDNIISTNNTEIVENGIQKEDGYVELEDDHSIKDVDNQTKEISDSESNDEKLVLNPVDSLVNNSNKSELETENAANVEKSKPDIESTDHKEESNFASESMEHVDEPNSEIESTKVVEESNAEPKTLKDTDESKAIISSVQEEQNDDDDDDDNIDSLNDDMDTDKLNPDETKDDDVISVDSTPDKRKYNKKYMPGADVTPRRSSRNLNKQKSYAEKDFYANSDDLTSPNKPKLKSVDDDDIEEVTPTDPLADEPKSKSVRNKTIVVSDTKGLVEFASNTKPSKLNKKEPTLVIIDTNSILSGRGPVPVSQSQSAIIGQNTHISLQPHSSSGSMSSLANSARLSGVSLPTTGFSMIPISLPGQGVVYPTNIRNPPQMKPIVITPAQSSSPTVAITSTTTTVTAIATATAAVSTSTNMNVSSATPKAPVILPSLTDDMFVVEAPSFIVPYVYEKPPKESLKLFIEHIETNIKEIDEKEKKRKKELEEKELQEKELEEKKEVKELEENKEVKEKELEDKELKEKESEENKEEHVKDEPMEEVTEKQETESMDVTDTESETKKDEKSEKSISDIKNEEKDVKTDTVEDEKASDKDVKANETGLIKDVKQEENEDSTKMEVDKVEPKQTIEILEDETKPDLEKKSDDIDKNKKPAINSYFDNPLGKFFMQIGLNLVQEHVQTDLLRTQKRKRDKEGGKCSEDVQAAITSLAKTLEFSKENNDPFKLDLRKCDLCSFKTEAILVMNHHLETPHMKNYTYRCNFCPLEVRSPHDILFHMEAEHCVRGRLERAPAFHQCPNCPFEDNQKGKLTRHLVSCLKKYRPERNQEPPLDWEPPAKIPRVTRNRPPSMNPANAVYQAAMSGIKQVQQNTLLPKLMPVPGSIAQNLMNRNRPMPKPAPFINNRFPVPVTQSNFQQRPISQQPIATGMMYNPSGTGKQTPMLLPAGFQMSGAQIYQNQQNVKQLQQHQQQQQQQQQGLATAKLLQQPSISITPLPRQTNSPSATAPSNSMGHIKPGRPQNNTGNKNSAFVICEICDGYIKDLEQLRNHMQWIHKVKIHPKMIYNRPPLNCQKCQFRFFTDQGLERHLLGSHGLVTSSMQEAANKGKDGGRCPVCGRVYQWKLLNHVARDHNMALKPAHLSYKCTVCTATFGMYKQFESHVYSAHSVVAKRAIENKKPMSQSPSSQNDALLKPLKINDEITIIPQPARISKPNTKIMQSPSSGSSKDRV